MIHRNRLHTKAKAEAEFTYDSAVVPAPLARDMLVPHSPMYRQAASEPLSLIQTTSLAVGSKLCVDLVFGLGATGKFYPLLVQVADSNAHTDAAKQVSEVVGSHTPQLWVSFSQNRGYELKARFSDPQGLRVDPAGVRFIHAAQSRQPHLLAIALSEAIRNQLAVWAETTTAPAQIGVLLRGYLEAVGARLDRRLDGTPLSFEAYSGRGIHSAPPALRVPRTVLWLGIVFILGFALIQVWKTLKSATYHQDVGLHALQQGDYPLAASLLAVAVRNQCGEKAPCVLLRIPLAQAFRGLNHTDKELEVLGKVFQGGIPTHFGGTRLCASWTETVDAEYLRFLKLSK